MDGIRIGSRCDCGNSSHARPRCAIEIGARLVCRRPGRRHSCRRICRISPWSDGGSGRLDGCRCARPVSRRELRALCALPSGSLRLGKISMRIALASPRVAASLDDGLDKIRRFQAEASDKGAEIICFPEAYLPGLRGQDFEVFSFDRAQQERALREVGDSAREHAIATILCIERESDEGAQIVAYVIDADGEIQGYQTKNQLDPT